jgi:biotin synthase
VLEMVRTINKLDMGGLPGMITENQTHRLAEAGLAYNHNLDTSEEYYKGLFQHGLKTVCKP